MRLDDLAFPESTRERFFRHVRITDGCWLWTGNTDKLGYGMFGITLGPQGEPAKTGPKGRRGDPKVPRLRKGRTERAHRVALILDGKELKTGEEGIHKCDNTSCVRVHDDHVVVGTQVENVSDMDAKGRRRVGIGERHGSAKLSDDQVREIRRRKGNGEHYLKLANEFGITPQNLYDIVARNTWKHLE